MDLHLTVKGIRLEYPNIQIMKQNGLSGYEKIDDFQYVFM